MDESAEKESRTPAEIEREISTLLNALQRLDDVYERFSDDPAGDTIEWEDFDEVQHFHSQKDILEMKIEEQRSELARLEKQHISRDINHVVLQGGIISIDTISALPNGQQFLPLLVRTDVLYTTKNGVVRKITDIHKVLAFGKYATVIKSRSSLGSRIYLTGRLKHSSRQRQGVTFRDTCIFLETFQLLQSI